MGGGQKLDYNTFRLRPLDSKLFDPERTPTLSRVRLRDKVMQPVIRLLSLTRPVGKRKRRGRISYAQLGINQLGAVYESLLSYQGFFAKEDLYEVKKDGEKRDELETAWFVPGQDLDKYTEGEKVFVRDDDGRSKLLKYPKGMFIYRRTGRSRESSASYYTPESLTRLVVKYAMKERIKEDMPAREILELTVCEPAMGSGAFLTEAVNQLAEKYLERRQKELGKRVPRADYPEELQRVKHYITDRNVYGVDLNPVAVELGEISLWLNCIGKDGHVPWFGFQLHAGNSLVGARRQVYRVEDIGKAKDRDELWFNFGPERVTPSRESKRPLGTVYHFLLPDPGMANYRDKFVQSLEPVKIRAIRDWRKEFCKPFSDKDIKTLESLSDAIDKLWTLHTEQLAIDREATRDSVRVWGFDLAGPEQRSSNRWKEQIRSQGVFATGSKITSPFRRLKLIMDYWCALWFWPLDDAKLLPHRDEFLNETWFVLRGQIRPQDVGPAETNRLFGEEYANYASEITSRIEQETGLFDLDRLVEIFPRLALVDRIGRAHKFHHWELMFSDVFYPDELSGDAREGFDVVLGNPPWVKVERREKDVLGDFDPQLYLRNHSAQQVKAQRNHLTNSFHECKDSLLSLICGRESVQEFLNSHQNYPSLKGQQTNLYKCFLPQSWRISRHLGVTGFLHPEGVYDDPNGGTLRAEIYRRLRAHFQFQNQQNLFPEIGHRMRFSVNIYSVRIAFPRFHHIANIFSPATVDECFSHDGDGPIPDLKDSNGMWETGGHLQRIINVGESELKLFSELLGSDDAELLEARLPALHSTDLLTAIRKISQQKRKVRELCGQFYFTKMFDETGSQQKGLIRRLTRFPEGLHDFIFSGPHFATGNPLYKTPRDNCKSKADYDIIDLMSVQADYIPRTNYCPEWNLAGRSQDSFVNRIPVIPWLSSDRVRSERIVTNAYRCIYREMTDPSLERSLVSALIPPEAGHISTCISAIFATSEQLLDFHSICISLPLDFFVKTLGASHVHSALLESFPFPELSAQTRSLIHLRTLVLNCLTECYAQLWSDSWKLQYKRDSWTKSDIRLRSGLFNNLDRKWNREYALRSDFERRQALVEVDVLVSMELGLSLGELISIYRTQFPVLQQTENDTWFDRHGRIAFTASRGLSGIGMPRKATLGDTSFGLITSEFHEEGIALGWDDVRELSHGVVTRDVLDDSQPSGPRSRTIEYHAPFALCDRESDYRTAWKGFEQRIGCS